MRLQLAVLSLVVLFFVGMSVAAPQEGYEGRPIPGLVKRLIYEKACDLPGEVPDGCADGSCILRRSNGTAFRPDVQPWQSLPMYEWSAGATTLGPALVEGRLAKSDDEIMGSARTALELASGLPLQTKAADGGPLVLNPKLATWFVRELLPSADMPMCGTTAAGFYHEAFESAVRALADVYVALQKKGLTRAVGVAALARSFDNQSGKFANACKAIGATLGVREMVDGRPSGEPVGDYARVGECWWWLRRVASGSVEPAARVLGEVLERYDPEYWKKVGKAFPKPVK